MPKALIRSLFCGIQSILRRVTGEEHPNSSVSNSSFRNVVQLFRFSNYNFLQLWLPGMLGLIGTLFEGISIVYTIPTIRMLVDYGAVATSPVMPPNNWIPWFSLSSYSRNAVLIILLVIVISGGLLKCLFQYFSILLSVRQMENAAHRLRIKIHERYLGFGKHFFDQNNSGRLQQFLLGHTALITTHIRYFLSLGLPSFFALGLYFLIMVKISWSLTLLVATALPISHYLFNWLVNKLNRTSEDHAQAYIQMSKETSNALDCLPLIQLWNKEKIQQQNFDGLSQSVQRFQNSIDKKQYMVPPSQEVLLLMFLLLLIMFINFVMPLRSSHEVARTLVFFLILKKSVNNIGIFTNMRASFAVISGLVKQLLELFSDEGKQYVAEGPKEFSGLKKGISFQNLTFAYPGGAPILKSVSFNAPCHSMTAIVGPTGAGKSTLAQLLARFYNSPKGQVIFDGVDVNEYTIRSIRDHMAMVFQDALLFDKSIYYNLTFGLEGHVTHDEVIQAVKKARLYDFIMQLPHQFETHIGERGVRLSGGEKQRLEIARALLKKSDILILDEATSALDSETELLIQEALNAAFASVTSIVIAHRLSTIKRASQIVVLENGEVKESGSLDELMARKGRFYGLWNAQNFY